MQPTPTIPGLDELDSERTHLAPHGNLLFHVRRDDPKDVPSWHGSTVIYEDPAQVNHERHAENLAVKIARDSHVEGA